MSGLAERLFSDPPRVPPRPQQGSLIEVVNRDGLFVYGSLLGVFILAIMTKRATATGAFVGLIAGMAAVLTVALELPWIEFAAFAFYVRGILKHDVGLGRVLAWVTAANIATSVVGSFYVPNLYVYL